MIEVIIHGRGGQGVVIASEILAAAMFEEGKHVQAFPAFGAERRGAQVEAFMRADDSEILLRCQIEKPDHLIVLDSSIFQTKDLGAQVKPGGWIVANCNGSPDLSKQSGSFKLATVDATSIAVKYRLGTASSAIVNTAILGAFSKVTNTVQLEALLKHIKEYVPVKPEANVEATNEAYKAVEEVK